MAEGGLAALLMSDDEDEDKALAPPAPAVQAPPQLAPTAVAGPHTNGTSAANGVGAAAALRPHLHGHPVSAAILGNSAPHYQHAGPQQMQHVHPTQQASQSPAQPSMAQPSVAARSQGGGSSGQLTFGTLNVYVNWADSQFERSGDLKRRHDLRNLMKLLKAQNASNDEWMAQITGSLGPEMRARFLQQGPRQVPTLAGQQQQQQPGPQQSGHQQPALHHHQQHQQHQHHHQQQHQGGHPGAAAGLGRGMPLPMGGGPQGGHPGALAAMGRGIPPGMPPGMAVQPRPGQPAAPAAPAVAGSGPRPQGPGSATLTPAQLNFLTKQEGFTLEVFRRMAPVGQQQWIQMANSAIDKAQRAHGPGGVPPRPGMPGMPPMRPIVPSMQPGPAPQVGLVGQKRALPVPQQQGPPFDQRRVRAKSEERDQLANNVLQAAGVDEEAEGNAATGAAVAAVNAPREMPCLNAWPLQNQLLEAMNRHGVSTADARIVNYLSHAVDAQLESLLRRTFTSAQQRADMARDQPGMVVTGDVRRGLAEIRKQDEQKAALKQAAEDAALARDKPQMTLSMALQQPLAATVQQHVKLWLGQDVQAEEQKGMDDETKERIKAKREAELERTTRNQTSAALAGAFGDSQGSKWQKWLAQKASSKAAPAPAAPAAMPAVMPAGLPAPAALVTQPPRPVAPHLMQAQALGQPTRALLPSTRVGQRGKIATLRDVIAVLERDPLLNKSTLLYTLMEKMHASNLQS